MQKVTEDHRIDRFIRTCQAHRLKVTPQRTAIYQAVLKARNHPSADAIYQTVRNRFTHISFDTVNRALLTFARIGLVEVVETFGGAKRFDSDVSGHHHLHCIHCGRIFDFHSSTYDHLAVPEEIQDQFQVISRRVVLRGICRGCRVKQD